MTEQEQEKVHGWEQAIAALPADEDVPNTPREQERIWWERTVLTGRIRVVRTERPRIDGYDAEIARLTPQAEDQRRWRQEFVDELLALSENSTDRKVIGRIQHLRLSIVHIDRGFDRRTEMYPAKLPLDDKMREAGYVAPAREAWNIWASMYGPLPTIEKRIAVLTKLRDEAQERLDGALRERSTDAASKVTRGKLPGPVQAGMPVDQKEILF